MTETPDTTGTLRNKLNEAEASLLADAFGMLDDLAPYSRGEDMGSEGKIEE